jgi:hypothetical protein
MAFYTALDRTIFEFALTRLQQRKAELDAQIGSVLRQLGRKLTPAVGSDSSPAAAVAEPAARKRRRKSGMSAEGKARVAAAQRKRWAALKKKAKGSK